VFERLFKERGLPANMRSDNGVPFASEKLDKTLQTKYGIKG
jgi:hypothetical protein